MRFLLAFAAFLALTTVSGSADAGSVKKGSVVVAPLKGDVSEAQFFFLRRALKEAESEGAIAFVVDMNTYGGGLQSAVHILELFEKARIPTYTYVNTNAGSAGALIALATKFIYMAPVSAIGAAAPVMAGGEDVPETMNAKTVSYFSGYFRSAAEQNGHNPDIAEGFINKNKEVKVGDKVINEKGSLLTLSAQEAVRVIEGKPLLAMGTAKSIEDLVEKAGLRGNTVTLEPSGFERLAQWITMLAPLFLLGGIVGAYIEMKSPGFGVAGFLSIACFGIFFAGHYIAGLTGLEVVAVFVLGALLIVTELILFPGVMFLAVLGAALMLGSLLFAMVDYFPGDPVVPNVDALAQPIINLSIAVALGMVAIALLARFLPDIPLFRGLFLSTQSAGGPSLKPAEGAVFRNAVEAGDIGIARTILRPAGTAQFGAALVDVVTEGDFIEPGASVRVLRVEGSRIVVVSA